MTPKDDAATLKRRLRRERAARLEAESIAEQITRDLYEAGLQLAAAQAVLDETTDFVAITDVDGRPSYLNKAYAALLSDQPGREGAAPAAGLYTDRTREWFRTEVLPVLEADGRWRGESALAAGPEMEIPVSQVLIAHRRSDGQIERISSVSRDITEQRTLHDQLARQASLDPLTGLANRRIFHQQLTTSLAEARRSNALLAVLFIDLDGFKAVNDSLGHDAGDLVLTTVAARLTKHKRHADLLARFGGDEFALICPAITDADDVHVVVDRLTRAVRQPIDVAGRLVRIGMSTGGVLSRGHDSPYELLARADAAMYEAKRAGKGRHHLDATNPASPVPG